MAQPKKYLTSLQAAALLLVSPVTVRQWAQKGVLPSVSTAGGHRRFLLDDVRRFASEHGIHLEETTPAPAAGRSDALRVLVVEDDRVYSGYLREIITRAQADVLIEDAADGFEAGQLTEKLRPHLVVLDINMPRVDGIELCRRLRGSPTTSGARIVVLSASLTPDNTAAVKAAGADAWLEKGASRADILEALLLPRRIR